MYFQKTIVAGNLGKDAESSVTKDGDTVFKFSLAVNSGDHTEWFKVVLFAGKSASKNTFYDSALKKGSKALCEGRLKTRSWVKDGAKNYITELLVNSVELTASAKAEEQFSDDNPFGEQSS